VQKSNNAEFLLSTESKYKIIIPFFFEESKNEALKILVEKNCYRKASFANRLTIKKDNDLINALFCVSPLKVSKSPKNQST